MTMLPTAYGRGTRPGLNNHWAFEAHQASAVEALRFVIANTAMMGVNVLTNASVLALWPSAVAPAFVAATTVASLLGFASRKWWVFRS